MLFWRATSLLSPNSPVRPRASVRTASVLGELSFMLHWTSPVSVRGRWRWKMVLGWGLVREVGWMGVDRALVVKRRR